MNNKEMYEIYDKSYKEFFSSNLSIKQLLQSFIKIDLVKYIDFNSIELINK
jgi:formiminotetrahydrofolate cyclodeaminase